MCVETILINTIASSLQALACHIDTHRKHNLACLVSEEHQRLFVKDLKKRDNCFVSHKEEVANEKQTIPTSSESPERL